MKSYDGELGGRYFSVEYLSSGVDSGEVNDGGLKGLSVKSYKGTEDTR